jgi:hypothetical protein
MDGDTRYFPKSDLPLGGVFKIDYVGKLDSCNLVTSRKTRPVKPFDNPYKVTSFLYIDSGVTLTIQPGVEVRYRMQMV